MNIKEQVLKEMRNKNLYLVDVKSYIENNVEDAFNICCRKNLSINEKYPDSKYSGQLGQKTVFLTVKTFDLWETALTEILSERLSKKFPQILVKPINDPIGDLLIIFPNGEEMRWEIKSSQALNSFTGATHSSSKCNNYILINYELNKDLKLEQGKRNEGFIKQMAVFIWDDMDIKWVGKATSKNSFTSLKIPVEIMERRPEIVVVGKLIPSRKWCKIARETKEPYGKV